MKQKNSNRILKRTGALALALLMAAALIPVLNTRASAVTSLTHIEEIKAGASTFNILEIVPTAGSGTIGYYIAGQEPTANWFSEAAKKDKAGRAAYVSGVIENLQTLGLMNKNIGTDADKYPLAYTAAYKEYYPWETVPAGVATQDMTLAKSETQAVNSTFTAASGGGYNLNSTAQYVGAGKGGYVQNVKNFVYTTSAYTPADGSTVYYYAPIFTQTPIDFSAEGINDTLDALAKADNGAGTAMYTPVYKAGTETSENPEIDHYQYAGTLGVNNFMLDTALKYYYVESVDLNSAAASYSSQTPYYSVLNDTTPYKTVGANSGCFTMSETDYVYVGAGKGEYAISTGTGTPHNVSYNTIKVAGGYTNNNWFLKNVFDVDTTNAQEVAKYNGKIQVYCVTPNSGDAGLTQNLTSLMDASGLVVVSGGLAASGKTVTGTPLGVYKGTTDITGDQLQAVKTAISGKKAVLLDSGLVKSAEASTNVYSLAAYVKNMNTASQAQSSGFVKGGVYYFVPDADRVSVATPNFAAKYSSTLYNADGTPFYEVYNEAHYENFLRKTANSSTADLVSEDASVATSVRYIINYGGQRIVNAKSSIRVLDVEPKTQSASSSGKLAISTVESWLPADSLVMKNTDTAKRIVIDTMSSAEFISKIDDINEKYDLVYIGASADNLPSGLDYTDENMDGMYYSNIGDIVYKTGKYTGLMDSDYDGDTKYAKTASSLAYRLSGNDITKTKSTELENFAASGLPVVVSQKLLNAETPATQLKVELAAANNQNGSVTLTATATLTPGLPGTLMYTFYDAYGDRIGDSAFAQTSASSSAVSASKAVTITGTGYVSGNYYCKVAFKADSAGAYSTEARSNDVNLSVALGEDTAAEQAYYPQDAYPYVVPISVVGTYSDRDVYSVSTGLNGTPVYTWQYAYKKGNNYYGWYDCSSSQYYSISNDSRTLTSYSNSYIRCKVTVGGYTYYYSPAYRYGSVVYSLPDQYASTTKLSVSISVNSNMTAFTAAANTNPDVSSAGYEYQWQYMYPDGSSWYNISGQTNQTYSGTISRGSYRCLINVVGQRSFQAKSNVIVIGTGWSGTALTTGATTVDIPSASATVNSTAVDNCSVLYDTLSNILTRANVVSDKNVSTSAEKSTLLKYLNLSKPSISLTSKPVEYDGSGDISSSTSAISTSLASTANSDRTLSYTFTISNPTDPTPVSTQYTCQLFVDLNADGRYRANEEITDLLITYKDSGGSTVVASENALRAGTAYTVSRRMPNNYSGIISWCIKVTQNNADGKITETSRIHASQTGYTYIQPPDGKPTVIKVLQISSKSGGGGRLTLDNTGSVTGTRSAVEQKYLNLFTKLKEKNVFDIQVTTKTVSEVNELGSSGISTLLSDKDMLILGFGDGYGWKETGGGLDSEAASAVVSFINSGKAVLFTHDTTSFVNLPGDYENSSHYTTYSNDWYWGYYFNSVVRDAVGLDRYGVTSPAYGVTKYSPNVNSLRDNKSAYKGIVSSGYSGAFTTAAAALEASGYSVAYLPGSRTESNGTVSKTAAPQAQGYTDVQLNVSGGHTATSTVSQVNMGQVTTFPFNINTTDFDSKNTAVGATLSVGETHDQYYQLNMNSNDIVVWYCLAGGSFESKYKNDGVNGYYIYNRGNVTYSGAGHSPGATTDSEAKLFVNTMIAAYRAKATNPTMEFNEADGKIKTTQLLPVDFTSTNGTAGASGQASESTRIYFQISDANLVSQKRISIRFYYPSLNGGTNLAVKDASGSVVETVTASEITGADIYTAAGKKVCGMGDAAMSLRSDTLYYFDIPKTALDALAQLNSTTVKLYGVVTTTIGSPGTDYVGYGTLELTKLGYRFLR